MKYIVLDLEWNQNPNERQRPNPMLPFEIIEIGAVMLDENRQVTDTFHRLIKPGVYHWIQDSVHQVIHINYKDLRKGVPFAQAAEDFMAWCGEDFRFCTWAKQDLTELQRNMKYYYLLDLLPGPLVYYDVQKLYSFSFEDGKERRSLKAVIEQLKIPKDQGFHRALSDAIYTARIFQRIGEDYLEGYESIDVFQNPRDKKDEFHIFSGNQERLISREFRNRDKVMADKDISGIHCPVCGGETVTDGLAGEDPLRKKPYWFMTSAKTYLQISRCPEHGYVAGRIRIRHTPEDMYFAVKTLRIVEESEMLDLLEKQEMWRERKKLK